MTIASGTSPTSSDSNHEYELETGLRPDLTRSRTGHSANSLSFPFPAVHIDSRVYPSLPTPTHPPLPSPPPPPPPPPPSTTRNDSDPNEHGFSVKTQTSHTWSTAGTSSSDPHYDRMVFDYRVLAQSMHAYRHLSIFRRFGRLSMANLLSYQDELTDLEDALRLIDREEQHHHRSETELKESRRTLMRRLRDVLKNYYEALLLQEQIFSALEPPRSVDAKLLGDMAPAYPTACAAASPRLVDEHTDDLVALGLAGRDSLEKLVGRYVPAFFPGRNPSAEDLRSRNRSSRDIASLFSPFTRRVTRMVIAVGTVALMLGPMAVLMFLKSDGWRLVCISVCTVLLAVSVALGTRGRGEAIVMVISAYAAVLVVFVQNNQMCGGSVRC